MTTPDGNSRPRSALLVMDVQTDIVSAYVDNDAYLPRLNGVVRAARAALVRPVFVRVAFRDGHPEISPNNRRFSGMKTSGRLLESSSDSAIHPDLDRQATDIVVTKHRVNAFWATDLDQILRANAITDLVLCGIATSGVVLSTLRSAADQDYRLSVLADCCIDPDPEVHEVLTKKVFRSQARVLDAQTYRSELASSA